MINKVVALLKSLRDELIEQGRYTEAHLVFVIQDKVEKLRTEDDGKG